MNRFYIVKNVYLCFIKTLAASDLTQKMKTIVVFIALGKIGQTKDVRFESMNIYRGRSKAKPIVPNSCFDPRLEKNCPLKPVEYMKNVLRIPATKAVF